ncbi:protein ALP1-like [Patiria miniata]|uniref:DDE Tnp4 domain-containing protein n=1 Tax=Patiria miniata TaxID=46514 RepID=A0A913Z717_PATMI|nr:protein ALP1-like [Patiria miniata]
MRGVSHMFGLSKSTVHSCIHKVAATISSRRHSVIRWPDQTRQAHIAEGFAGESCLRGIVGVIDGTHIRIINILNGQPDYINRKSYPSVQLQLVVDDMMLITDAYVGWPGSVHDARVFRNSPLYHDVEDGHKLAEHQYLIGDTAYPLRSWLVTPFKDNGHLSQQQRRFNRMLSGKRQVVERAIGHLKGRFRRLRELMFHDISQICQFIMATCVMHNLCVLSDDDVSSFINFDDQDDMELENIFADATGGHVRRNALVAQC